jgi:hypothetical protein
MQLQARHDLRLHRLAGGFFAGGFFAGLSFRFFQSSAFFTQRPLPAFVFTPVQFSPSLLYSCFKQALVPAIYI